MGRDHVRKTGKVVDDFLEAEKAFAAGIRFVAAHHSRPLVRGHSAGAGIGQQIDQNIGRTQLKKVVTGLVQELFALRGSGVAQWLDAADAEWLDDGFHPPLSWHKTRRANAVAMSGSSSFT